MSSELKPVAYMHYWIGGYPPDGYVEESELLTPFQAEAYKDLESNEAHGIVPLVIVPEGYALVPMQFIEQAASDNNNRSVNWRKSTINIFNKILQAAQEGD